MSEPEALRKSWTRRLFVRDTLLGWLGLVLGPIAYSLLGRHHQASTRSTETEKDLGRASEFKPGVAKEVALGGKKVLIVRLDGGEWVALSAVCTHLGCSVRFLGDGREDAIACNCHDSRFAKDGSNISGPAPSPLAQYEIEERADKVILRAKAEDDGKTL